MTEVGNMNLGWESVKGFLGKMVQSVFGFVGMVIFARILGPTSFGGFYFLKSLVELSDRGARGFSSAVKKRYSEDVADHEKLLGALVAANILFTIVVGMLLIPLASRLQSQTNVEQAGFVFFCLFSSIVFFSSYQRVMGAMGLVSKQTWNDTLRSVLTLPFQIGFVAIGFGAAGMGYGLAAATLMCTGVGIFYVDRKPQMPTKATFVSLWDFAKYSIPGSFIGKAYDRFDVVILGFFLSTSVVGYYETALKLTVPATFLSGVILTGLMPKVSNLHSKGEDFRDDINNAISYVSIIAIPLFFGVLAMPDGIIHTTYGAEYVDAAPYLVGLALYQVIYTQGGVFRSTLQGIDRPDATLKVDSLTLAFNIVTGIGLIFMLGGIGVVIATVASESIRYLFTMNIVREEVGGVAVAPRPLFEQLGVGFVMFLFVHWFYTRMGVNSWVDLGIIVGSGVAFYCIGLVLVSRSLRITVSNIVDDSGLMESY